MFASDLVYRSDIATVGTYNVLFQTLESYIPTLAFSVVLHLESDERFALARLLVGEMVLKGGCHLE